MLQIHIAGFIYYVSAQMLIVAVVALMLMFVPRFKKLHLARYAFGLCLGLLLIIATALTGFYSRGVQGGNDKGYVYYNGGDTDVWVSSHSPLVAVQSTLADPSVFITRFLNDCNELEPMNTRSESCSNDHYFTGVAVAELMLVGGMVLGSVFTKRQKPELV